MKRARVPRSDIFESLHDDIVIYILCKLSSTASSPSDFISVLLTCKRLNKLGLDPLVLSKSCSNMLAVRAKNWSDEAHKFLNLCVNAGNQEAYYTLGMIRFYCLENRRNGASMMAKAAIKSHAPALYSLAVILFNGSGRVKNLRAGVAVCARAAFLGDIDATRELGHCVQDGYGVRKNVAEGRRLLAQANARELAREFDINPSVPQLLECGFNMMITGDMHPVNRFMVEWFGLKGVGEGLRMCCYERCGRPETRTNEFRRCTGCGKVNYCSRVCQSHDWMARHNTECAPAPIEEGVMVEIVQG